MPSLSHSARPALLGAVLALALGCASVPTAPTTDVPIAFTAQLTPKLASLAPGATLAFTATASEPANWSATGGTISDAGVFTAPAARGTYRVIARWPKHDRSDTAVVTVVPPASPPVAPPVPPPAPALTSLLIAPDSMWMTQLDTMVLAAVGRDAAGDSVVPTVSWSATGGTVDSGGQFVAGLTVGDYVVTARSGNGLVAHTAVHVDPNIIEILVTPPTVSVTAGHTQQFTAKGVTIAHDTIAVSVIWHASGGTISSTGLFTAGSAAGSYSVWCELVPPTWGGSPVIFTRRGGLSGRVARVPVTASATVHIGA
jgi:hypothetical protein